MASRRIALDPRRDLRRAAIAAAGMLCGLASAAWLDAARLLAAG